MGYFIACMVSRADRLAHVLAEERQSVHLLSTEQEYGWGIGFYQAGEVLHKKRPQPVRGPIDWASEVGDIRSHCLIAHAGTYDHDNLRAENTHPFRMRHWLFAHNGGLERFSVFKTRFAEAMPDFIQRNIRGDSASEYLFHALLSFIHDAGQLDNPDAPDATVVTALRSTVRLVDRLSAEVSAPAGVLNLALTNGRKLYVLRRGAPMALRAGTGLPQTDGTPDELEKLPAETRDGTRYLLVLSGALPRVPVGYEEIPDGTVVSIDRDLNVGRHSL